MNYNRYVLLISLMVCSLVRGQAQIEYLDRPSGAAASELALWEEGGLARRATVPLERKISDQPPVASAASAAGRTRKMPRVPASRRRIVAPNMQQYEGKRNEVVQLIEDAADYFVATPFDEACHVFTRTKQFMRGELYIMLFDMNGVCYAHANDNSFIWHNVSNLQDAFGSYFVKDMIQLASRAGQGWITYEWHNAAKVTYVKKVVKNQKAYVLGCGFFPHSAEDSVVNLVKGAVSLFNQEINAGHSPNEAFSAMSYPTGSFVSGSLYLYAADFNGNLVAQGSRPELIGTNVLKYQDERGLYLNQEIINRLKKTDNGVWIDYISTKAPKRAYAEKIQDKQGKYYFIACGYYPDADRTAVVDLVRRGYAFMKGHGLSAAEEEFTDKRNDNFRYGDLYLFVYDLKGVCRAHGGNETFVGQNQLNLTDQDGQPYIKLYIQEALRKPDGVWVNAKLKNAFQTTYVQLVNLGIDKYVIGCSLYPISKEDSLTLLVNSAVNYLNGHPRADAFSQFMNVHGTFMRGDLDIFVFDTQGICFVYNNDANLIWRNIGNLKDDQGKYFVRDIIRASGRGEGSTTYTLNGAQKTIYSKRVEKDRKIYVVGSGYYE